MILFILIYFVVPFTQAVSEAPEIQWSSTYGLGQSSSLIQTADGGYLIAAIHLDSEARLIKTSQNGEIEWEKRYGNEVFGGSRKIVSVVQTRDLGYVLFGEGGHIVRTDTEGIVQWIEKLNLEGIEAGIETVYKDYVLVGNTKDVTDYNVAWIVKVDEEGNVLWKKDFTGGGYTVYAVAEGFDGGYVFGGSYKECFWLSKTDSRGNAQWDRKYSYGGLEDMHHVNSIAKANDGGFMLAGTGDWQASGGEVPWLIKTDFSGNEKWHRVYEDMPSNGFVSSLQTEDGGCAAILEYSATLVKMDDLGQLQWKTTYGDASSGYTYPTSLIRTEEGGFAIVGSSSGLLPIWLVKTWPETGLYQTKISISSPESKTYSTDEISIVFNTDQSTWIGYSLNGNKNVTITGNTTLAQLSENSYSLRLYIIDNFGNSFASETIHFSIVRPFPWEWIVTLIVTTTVVSTCFLAYFKKLGLIRQILLKIRDNNIVRNLAIISFCIFLILVQIFFPFIVYSSFSNENSTFQVGVSYVYEEDNIGQIFNEVSKIQALGFKVIRINMVCDPTDPNEYSNILTEEFFMSTSHYDVRVALIINNDDSIEDVRYYFSRWGSQISYIQILNEPELSSSWSIGALYTDDEIFSKFQEIYAVVEPYRNKAKLYTNFEAGYILRTNVPIELSENLDFVGYDVFMESFLVLSPSFIQFLQKTTKKEVVITEFGMSTTNEAAQRDYIIRGLNLFKSMGLKGCWIAYWNSVNNNYGIRGRMTEKSVGEWIAENSNAL